MIQQNKVIFEKDKDIGFCISCMPVKLALSLVTFARPPVQERNKENTKDESSGIDSKHSFLE